MTSRKIDVETKLLPRDSLRNPPRLEDEIPFGRLPSNYMFVCDFLPAKGGWQNPQIVPFESFDVKPNALVFHYGQTIFEGLKAYRSPRGDSISLFRPSANAKRMARSAQILGMEPVPEELFLKGVRALVNLERDWVLPSPASLYIRPTLVPLDEGVSYRSSSAFRFFIILSPAKNYYSRDTAISVYVERERVRAVPGGVGEAKCGGNYAAALTGLNRAKALGAEQVLWLDGIEHSYVEEVGAMNVMFVYGKSIVTPKLTGSILPGITRDSILKLAPHLGFEIREDRISIRDVVCDANSGKLTEVFGCGTAAVISPVGEFLIDGNKVTISNGEVGEVSRTLRKSLVDIQTGAAADPFGWHEVV